MPSTMFRGVQPVWALLACAALAAGVGVAAQHPLSPTAALAGLCLGAGVAFWRPGWWLFVLPAGLPALNFSPWTGWLIFDEFDLMLIATLVGGYAAMAREAIGPPMASAAQTARRPGLTAAALVTLFAAASLVGLFRGFADAGWSFGWFQGYADPLNSLRVGKSALYALLFLPLLRRELRLSTSDAVHRFATGMLAGLGVVVLAVLWERAAYPGLFDFTQRYRTVALFWEMHVGGAAIDAYLVVATPFVAWAVVSARSPLRWAGAAALAVLAEYACLTTFSRGVYAALAASLLLFGMLRLRAGGRPGWRRAAGWGLALVLALEAIAVVGPYMLARFAASERDFGGRLAHWRHGVGLLRGPADWVLGAGLGRLPSRYAAGGAAGELSGRTELVAENGVHAVKLFGPATSQALAGLFELTQRVAVPAGATFVVELDVRVEHPTDLRLGVCDMHLLYEARCQRGRIRVQPEAWQHLVLPLEGPGLPAGTGVFSIALLNAGTAAEFRRVGLRAAAAQLLANPDFADDLGHWFPLAQQYYLPWHIDNLYLELLIERGVFGLALVVGLTALALRRLIARRGAAAAIGPCLAAALCGALLLGLVSSFLDVPRVAFLFFLLVFFSLEVESR